MVNNPMVTIRSFDDDGMMVEVNAISERTAEERVNLWMIRNISPAIRRDLEVMDVMESSDKMATYEARISK